MTITHHLDDATLMSLAAGSLPEALAAVAAEHVARCAHCRKELRVAERLGQGLLHELAPAPLVKSEPDMDVAAVPRTAAKRPSVVQHLENVRWRWIGPGLYSHKIKVRNGSLHLLKAAPGAAVPTHDHSGGELTLVLQGALLEGGDRLGPGDVADHDEEVEAHRPQADAELGCICLIGSEHKARFRTILARLMQPFHGM
jgi:putative transcriptional regulator